MYPVFKHTIIYMIFSPIYRLRDCMTCFMNLSYVRKNLNSISCTPVYSPTHSLQIFHMYMMNVIYWACVGRRSNDGWGCESVVQEKQGVGVRLGISLQWMNLQKRSWVLVSGLHRTDSDYWKRSPTEMGKFCIDVFRKLRFLFIFILHGNKIWVGFVRLHPCHYAGLLVIVI